MRRQRHIQFECIFCTDCTTFAGLIVNRSRCASRSRLQRAFVCDVLVICMRQGSIYFKRIFRADCTTTARVIINCRTCTCYIRLQCIFRYNVYDKFMAKSFALNCRTHLTRHRGFACNFCEIVSQCRGWLFFYRSAQLTRAGLNTFFCTISNFCGNPFVPFVGAFLIVRSVTRGKNCYAQNKHKHAQNTC